MNQCGAFKYSDAVDYGSFFRPITHELLFRALRGARERGLDVHILVCGSPQPQTHASSAVERSLCAFKGDEEFEATLKIYLESLRGNHEKPFRGALGDLLKSVLKVPAYMKLIGNSKPTEAGLREFVEHPEINWHKNAEFIALLLCRHEWFAKRLRDEGIQIDVDWGGAKLDQFVWLRDGTEAIFLFSSAGDKNQKLGFRTRDPALVTTFKRIFRHKFDELETRASKLTTLRPATAADEAFVDELLRTTMSRYVEATWPGDPVAQQEYYDTNRFNPANTRIIQRKGVDIGRLSTTVRKDDCVFIDEIHIIPRYERQGIGTQVIEQVFEEAREKSLPVKLTVLAVNISATCLYRRMGFTVIEENNHRLLMQSH